MHFLKDWSFIYSITTTNRKLSPSGRDRDGGRDRRDGHKCPGQGTSLCQEVAVVGFRGLCCLPLWQLSFPAKVWATNQDKTAVSWTAPCRYTHSYTHDTHTDPTSNHNQNNIQIQQQNWNCWTETKWFSWVRGQEVKVQLWDRDTWEQQE